ncbi:MAG: hypothetical protein IPK07_29150 [Deltaproteobacteria bacterium]|nr:hypothetical protein [Deltaproteobacteria bacterium]
MKIAFTYLSDLGDRASASAAAEQLAAGLRGLGHDVATVDVAEPLVATVTRLTQLRPDLVFNTARAPDGRARESFYPALFADLGLAHTGSSAAVHALTLNPGLTRRHLAAHGIRTLRSRLIVDRGDLMRTAPTTFRFPVTLRPEGLLGEAERIDSPEALHHRVLDHLGHGAQGVWIEEVVPGRHVVVPVLEGARARGGVLAPIAIVPTLGGAAPARRSRKGAGTRRSAPAASPRPWTLEAPARIPAALRDELMAMAGAVVECLAIRDLGRVDFRVAEDGTPFVIEVDPLPGLEPHATLSTAAALHGLDRPEDVLEAIVRSASQRHSLGTRSGGRAKPKKRPLRVGFTFNVKRVTPVEGVEESEAEYDSPKTIAAIREAIESHGHEVIELEATPELPTRLVAAAPDVVFNMAEGVLGRNRESQVPALLEPRHPLHRLGPGGAGDGARQGARQAPGGRRRRGDAALVPRPQRARAPAQGFPLPGDREAGHRGELEGCRAEERGRERGRGTGRGARAGRALQATSLDRGLPARTRVHGRAPRRAHSAGAAADGDRVPRQAQQAPGLRLRAQAGLVEGAALRHAGEGRRAAGSRAGTGGRGVVPRPRMP